MSGPWLSVIGLDESGIDGLSSAAQTLIDQAEILIGGERHLAQVPDDGRTRLTWPSPLKALVERLPEFRGTATAILATGDPMAFGIGSTLVRHIAAEEMTILPGISAFSLAAARMRWPLHLTERFTLHGRPAETLAARMYPDARLLILAHDRHTPEVVADWLRARGFGASRMVAMGHMNGVKESMAEGRAADWSHAVPDFHTLAVECVAGPGADWQPVAAGVPDDAYVHDGQLTKREVRAVTVANLRPHPGAQLWDIGAGCGSVGIEWLRLTRTGRALALEPNSDRRRMIAQNAASLGVPELEIVDGSVPDALAELPGPPDAIFVGGGLSSATIENAIRALESGGRLVANAVTLESESLLIRSCNRFGGDLARISVARAAPVGSRSGWKPAMPVTQWSYVKREAVP